MKARLRSGFTLVELLVTIVIIGIVMSFAVGGMMVAMSASRASKTKALIAKMDGQLAVRWESYQVRRLPLVTDPSLSARVEVVGGVVQGAAPRRLYALRELMRYELPQRWEDVTSDTAAAAGAAPSVVTAYLPGPPALSLSYLRRYNDCKVNGVASTPTDTYQGAECLYLVLTMGLDNDGTGDTISSNRALTADETQWEENNADPNVGDKDGDGMLEYWDGWGNPITFLRWAPGFVSDRQPSTDLKVNGDPFDPSGVEQWLQQLSATPRGFALFPLVMSAGPDETMDIATNNATSDPYLSPFDGTATGEGFDDNIHNHLIGQR